MKNGKLMKHILVIGDRFTRKVWHIVLADKGTPTVIQGFKELMPEILDSDSTLSTRRKGKLEGNRPKQMVVDSAPWALSKQFEDYMASLGIVVRNKNSSNRQELQNNSVLDSAIHKIQRILKNRRKNSPTWVTHVPATIQEYNNTKNTGVGIIGSEPNEAAASKIIQFNIQEASGEALAESQKPVLKARAQLEQDGAFKEAVKDKGELAGRGRRKAAEDRWEGKVHQITGYRFGLVRDARRFTNTNEPGITKVQPVPS